MFITPKKIHHKYAGNNLGKVLPDRFGMLCWNLNKFNDAHLLTNELLAWERAWNLELLFLQEALFDTLSNTLKNRYEIHGAANLQLGGKHYGVMTASRTEASHTQSFHSKGREGLIGPKKPFLITEYPIPEKGKLLCLNLHAINFREERRYRLELEYVKEKLVGHEGPMIVAGDFNRWNSSRERRLNEFREILNLKQLDISSRHLKSFMGHPLDFILHRELNVKRYEVIDHEISDHNPILVEFYI